ncbi:MAG: polysaccharide pyruvyl transferase family protein [Ruminococcus sp.]|nr:polysaccharide pyruvyl transferase family protein [Ruminococcus sp.]
MKKTGIITFHKSYNYGSALQAFALQKFVNDNFGTATVIDYIQKHDFEQYKLFRIRLYKYHWTSFIADLVYFNKNLKRKNNFTKFLNKNIPITSKRYYDVKNMTELNKAFDIFICGSDQIWNPACTDGAEPAYFLEFVAPGKKKIAYAPSMGHVSFENDELADIKSFLSSFDAVSVREKSVSSLLQSLTDKKVEVTIDPTLLLTKKEYETILSECTDKNYIFVYMLEYSEDLIKYAQQQSEKTGKKIIYISKKKERTYKKAKNVFGIGPDSFLSYLRNADYVITNSFHATAFSIIFEKKFCTFRTEKSFSRMVDLLEILGLESRLSHKNFSLDAEIEYEKVKERLELFRKNSINFLKENMMN